MRVVGRFTRWILRTTRYQYATLYFPKRDISRSISDTESMAFPLSELPGTEALHASVDTVLVRHTRNATTIYRNLAGESIVAPIGGTEGDLSSSYGSTWKFCVKRNGRLALNVFETALGRKVALFVWCTALLLAACFPPSALGQGVARSDGSVPVPMDWSSKHVVFTRGSTATQAEKTRK